MTGFDLKEIFKPLSPEAMAACTVYVDALTALIRRECERKDIAGHKFTFDLTHAVAGHYTLRATDSFDGKMYKITVEVEKV